MHPCPRLADRHGSRHPRGWGGADDALVRHRNSSGRAARRRSTANGDRHRSRKGRSFCRRFPESGMQYRSGCGAGAGRERHFRECRRPHRCIGGATTWDGTCSCGRPTSRHATGQQHRRPIESDTSRSNATWPCPPSRFRHPLSAVGNFLQSPEKIKRHSSVLLESFLPFIRPPSQGARLRLSHRLSEDSHLDCRAPGFRRPGAAVARLQQPDQQQAPVPHPRGESTPNNRVPR